MPVETTTNTNQNGFKAGIDNDVAELKEGFGLLKQTVTKLIDDIRTEGMKRAEDLQGRAKDAVSMAGDSIRERPLIVAGVALVVGVVLGRLLSARF
jgi:ElaB/YqjD/DUF883 family membrane-anchored ribosome-binding protein